jgi:hypothetical protein
MSLKGLIHPQTAEAMGNLQPVFFLEDILLNRAEWSKVMEIADRTRHFSQEELPAGISPQFEFEMELGRNLSNENKALAYKFSNWERWFNFVDGSPKHLPLPPRRADYQAHIGKMNDQYKTYGTTDLDDNMEGVAAPTNEWVSGFTYAEALRNRDSEGDIVMRDYGGRKRRKTKKGKKSRRKTKRRV